MNKKMWLPLLLSLALVCVVIPSAAAFSDVQSHPQADRISALQAKGIIAGELGGGFNPNGSLSYAAGLTMIVKGLDLSLAKFTFIKAPQASDYFTHVKDGQWYSDAFIIAQVNGLDVPKDVKPNAPMTREQFAHHVMTAIETHGEYAYPMIYIMINDEADIAPEYNNSIQKVLVTRIASLDDEGNFKPKMNIKRGEAAGWLHDAIQFKAEAIIIDQEPSPLFDLTLTSEAVNADVNKVTIAAQAPHPGYGMRIASILFEDDKAVIFTEPIMPDPDMMYPQVIADVQASVYVGSEYKPILAEQWMNQTVLSE